MTTSIDDLLDTGRLDEASRRLSEQLQMGPASADALVAQGRLLGAQRDLEARPKPRRGAEAGPAARTLEGTARPAVGMGRQGEARPT